MTDTNTAKNMTTILVNDPPSEAELAALEMLRAAYAHANGGPDGTRLDGAASRRIEGAMEALYDNGSHNTEPDPDRRTCLGKVMTGVFVGIASLEMAEEERAMLGADAKELVAVRQEWQLKGDTERLRAAIHFLQTILSETQEPPF